MGLYSADLASQFAHNARISGRSPGNSETPSYKDIQHNNSKESRFCNNHNIPPMYANMIHSKASTPVARLIQAK